MPDVLLFGATGYTGRLTAAALRQKNISFAIAGRNREKLEKLARETGDPDIRIASAGDTDGLVKALDDVRVLVTCVGPFVDVGSTAVEAALKAGVHYIDSTGEGTFIRQLIDRDREARDAGIAMAPAMGFDEVPGDVAGDLAAEGFEHPDLHITYALPRTASLGTIRSALGILVSEGPFISEGRTITIRAGERKRWAPMPAPLGPRPSASFPLALGHLLPLHVKAHTMELYVTTGTVEGNAMRWGVPALRKLLESPARDLVDKALSRAPEGPTDTQRERGRWTILVEAREGNRWRNVTLQGNDVYGLTAETLATAAGHMAEENYDVKGVVAPVQAVERKLLVDVLEKHGVSFETYAPV
jgi:short subunit dehydrogenase-like uncharacterized protein